MGQEVNKYGDICVDKVVLAKYAGAIAIECFGIVGMTSTNVKDGFGRLLKKESLSRDVKVKIKDDKITIDFHVIIAYGIAAETVAENLVQTVKYKIEEFSGLKVSKINVYVEGVRILD